MVISVTKFPDGAWVILVVLPVLVVVLLRLNRQYSREAEELEEDVPAAIAAPVLRRHVVLVFIDRIDMAAGSGHPVRHRRTTRRSCERCTSRSTTRWRARLAAEWQRLGLTRVPLEIVECPDRRLTKAAVTTVARELADGETEVSVLLPERKYRGIWHRVLHDRPPTAIEEQVSRLPHANVTSVPFHFGTGHDARLGGGPPCDPLAVGSEVDVEDETDRVRPAEGALLSIIDVRWRDRITVQGRVRSMRVAPQHDSPTLEIVLEDDTASMSVVFLGRRVVAGIQVGTQWRCPAPSVSTRPAWPSSTPDTDCSSDQR